jgi:murein DD-endopeptidase MepM/ murein hydrolase activator NlpD
MRFVPLILWIAAVAGGTSYYFATRAALATRQVDSQPVRESAAAPAETAPPNTAIGLPIYGLRASDIHNTFEQTRDGVRRHEAIDILAPRGTPVHAVVDGVVKKLFLSKPGGLTLYQFDIPEEFSYYYAHLDRYADGVVEGRLLKRGDVLGYVGFTGNADPKAPHLHLAIFKLNPDKKWWEGTPVNPYPLLMKALRGESGL